MRTSTSLLLALVIVLSIDAVVFPGCTGGNDAVNLPNSPQRFDETFQFADSLRIVSPSLYSIMALAVDDSGRYWIADYLGKKILTVTPDSGRIEVRMNSGRGPGEVIAPMAIAFDDSGMVYVGDNTSRRLSILGRDGSLHSTFVISGGHIPPVGLGVSGGIITMAGFGISDNTLLHRYDGTGRYLGGYFKVPDPLVGTRLGGSLCYPYFDYLDGHVVAANRMEYALTMFDTALAVLLHKEYRPAYAIPLTAEIIDKSRKNDSPDELLGTITTMRFVGTVGDRIIVQTEMPRKAKFEGRGDFLAGAVFKIDVFGKGLEPKRIGLDAPGLLACIDKKRGALVFITELNYEKNSYTLKRFTLKNTDN